MPHGYWKTTPFVGALRLTGMTAPMVLDGPMHGTGFLAYVQQVLAPTLKPGDIVIMDDLAAHKSTPIRDTIEAVGARLCFQPPCSPDLNPIENAFAKPKVLLRKAAPDPSNSSGRPSPGSSRPTRPENAPTTSPPPAMIQTDRNMLWVPRITERLSLG